MSSHNPIFDTSIDANSPFVESLSLIESITSLILPCAPTDPVLLSGKMTECSVTCNSNFYSHSFARSVHEHKNAFMLHITDFPSAGITEISFCTHPSLARRHHVFIVLTTAPFQAAIRKLAVTGEYDTYLMRQALIYTFQSSETHDSISCMGQSHDSTCPIEHVREAHPLEFFSDFLRLRKCMTGNDDVSYRATHQCRAKTCHGRRATKVQVHLGPIRETRKTIEALIFQRSLKGKCYDMLQLRLPETDPYHLEARKSASGYSNSLSKSPASGKALSLAFEDANYLIDGAIEGAQYMHNDSKSLESIRDWTSDHYKRSSRTTSTLTSISRECGTGKLMKLSDSIGCRPLADSDTKLKEVRGKNEKPKYPLLGFSSIQKKILRSGQEGKLHEKTYKSVSLNIRVRPSKRKEQTLTPTTCLRTRETPTVPIIHATTALMPQKSMDSELDAYRRNDDVMQAQNRSSALRSNAKRKRRVSELERNLEMMKTQAAMLEREEHVLREANLKLRAVLLKRRRESSQIYKGCWTVQ